MKAGSKTIAYVSDKRISALPYRFELVLRSAAFEGCSYIIGSLRLKHHILSEDIICVGIVETCLYEQGVFDVSLVLQEFQGSVRLARTDKHSTRQVINPPILKHA